MKRSILVLMVMACTTGLLAQTGKKSASPAGNMAASMARGKQVFAKNCLTCHQADGSGVPFLNPPLIKTKWVLGDKATLIKLVLKGSQGQVEINGDTFHNNMPPQAHLTDQQIADVLTYIRNSFGNKASAVIPAQVKAVRAKTK